jgi:hypothetical protein
VAVRPAKLELAPEAARAATAAPGSLAARAVLAAREVPATNDDAVGPTSKVLGRPNSSGLRLLPFLYNPDPLQQFVLRFGGNHPRKVWKPFCFSLRTDVA